MGSPARHGSWIAVLTYFKAGEDVAWTPRFSPNQMRDFPVVDCAWLLRLIVPGGESP